MYAQMLHTESGVSMYTYEQFLIEQLEGLPVGRTSGGGCIGRGRGGCVVATHPLGSVHV